MKYIALLLTFISIGNYANAYTPVNQVWHVSGAGNDTNSGKSAAKAFRTLQHTAEMVHPGDTVLIGNGTYSNTDVADGSAVLAIKTSGTPSAWITWKAMPGTHPQINPKGWAGIQISASYQVIDGLDVIGGNDTITLSDAVDDAKKSKASARFNTNGIVVDGRPLSAEQKPHHIVIRNCRAGKCPGGGITMLETDYITIENCKVFENAWYMRYAGSGITTLNNWAFDDKPGYHIMIKGNTVWNNKTMVPWDRIGKLSDGNGILLDVTDLNEGATNPNADAVKDTSVKKAVLIKPKRPEWKGRALIANNLSFYNGGSGIHTFRTKGVDIINNTTYWNGQTVGYQELFPNRSDDIVILNNIMVPRPGGKVTSDNHNKNIKWDYNLYPEEQQVFKGEHDMVANPKFVKAEINAALADFRLLPGSPAIDSGTAQLLQPTDLAGKKRPHGKAIDRGCYEKQ